MKFILPFVLFFSISCNTQAQEAPVDSAVGGLPTKNKDTTNPETFVYTKVEIEAMYPGGESALRRYINKYIRYPNEAADKGIQGEVVIQFIVDKEGYISNIKPLRGHPLLLDEGVRLIKKAGRWLPAIQNGRLVKSYKQETINFKLY